MNGAMLAWFTTFLIALVVVLLLVIAAVLLPRTVRTLTRRFYCPWARRHVTVQFLTYDGQHPISVLACTAFADPYVPVCGRMCVGGESGAGLATGERKAADVLSD